MAEEINVDGIKDQERNIAYVGKATKMENGKWHCLANIDGELCLVEVVIKHTPISSEDKKKGIGFNCSFCGKSAAECEALIQGPMVGICNKCVEAAYDMVQDIRSSNTQISFIQHVKTSSPCETCSKHRPCLNVLNPWWHGICADGLKLTPNKRSCPAHKPLT